ncbi:MAG: DUF4928 family protein [Prosthecobacter sp.]
MNISLPSNRLNDPSILCLEAEVRRRSVEATLQDLLLTAAIHGCCAELALGLVDAVLAKSFRREASISSTVAYEFFIGNVVIKVVMDPLNHRHYEELKQRVTSSKREVWLLTRSDRTIGWRDAVRGTVKIPRGRVVVRSVESFVGQNITELAGFSAAGKVSQLKELFELYNTRWIAKVGTPGIRIIMK